MRENPTGPGGRIVRRRSRRRLFVVALVVGLLALAPTSAMAGAVEVGRALTSAPGDDVKVGGSGGWPAPEVTPATIQAAQRATGLFGWGSDYYGAVGTGDTSFAHTDVLSPTPVAMAGALAGRSVTDIVGMFNRTCALASGDIVCWGDRLSPVLDDVSGVMPRGSVTAFAPSSDFTCAVSRGKAYCRGWNDQGQLGNGSTAVYSDSYVPVSTDGPMAGLTVQQIVLKENGVCALADGRVFCWGDNQYGSSGNGRISEPDKQDEFDSRVPVEVDMSGAMRGLRVDEIGSVGRGGCARAQSRVFCWGSWDTLGSMAAPNPVDTPVPTEIDMTGALKGKTITKLSANGMACVLASGSPVCWGHGAWSWGTGDTSVTRPLPTQVQSPYLEGKIASDLSVGGPTCAMVDREPVCWGGTRMYDYGYDRDELTELPQKLYTGGALAGRTIIKLGRGTPQFAITKEPIGLVTAPGTFNAAGPVRALDTRPGAGGQGAVPGGGRVDVQVAGVNGIPSTAGAVSVNLTVTEPVTEGYLTAFAAGSARPGVSNLNFGPGRTVANMAVVKVGPGGRISVFNGSPSSAQVIVDVTGYHLGGESTTPGSLQTVAPTRLLDTRTGVGSPAQPVNRHSSISLAVAGQAGIPAGAASAVILNVTATDTESLGHVTAYAGGALRPDTSNLNFTPGATVAGLAVVPIGPNGAVQLFNGSDRGRIDLVADVVGYYLAGDPTAAGSYVAVNPTRVVDTRVGTGIASALPAGGSAQFAIAGVNGLARFAPAATVLNATVVNPDSSGHASVRPWFATGPATTSTVNFTAGLTVANGAISLRKGLVSNGSPGRADVVIDVFGFFHN